MQKYHGFWFVDFKCYSVFNIPSVIPELEVQFDFPVLCFLGYTSFKEINDYK